MGLSHMSEFDPAKAELTEPRKVRRPWRTPMVIELEIAANSQNNTGGAGDTSNASVGKFPVS